MHRSAVVVLGSPNDQEGRLSSLAIERCEQALIEHKRRPDAYILPTGGWGAHFNTTEHPHAYYLRQFFIASGVCERQILECAESANTIEDAKLTKPIVERHGISELIVVTSDFHVARAEFLFRREFHDVALLFSPAKTHLPEADLRHLKHHEEKALARLKAEPDSSANGSLPAGERPNNPNT